jgi:hypothetical protein
MIKLNSLFSEENHPIIHQIIARKVQEFYLDDDDL